LRTLAARITKSYQDHGYLLSRAYIPAQTLSDDTVRIEVLEARYGAI
jgi:hemolysin activation/secretion protein